jgi:NAD(P)-binding Rossmann-like domain
MTDPLTHRSAEAPTSRTPGPHRDRLRVAIVGGGIGGMSLALALHAAGFRDVDVYEAASRIRELGVGFNLLPHGTRELAELGLLDELYAAGIPTGELVFYSRHGQRIWREPRGLAAGYRWPQFSIHRGRLLGYSTMRCGSGSAPSACTPAIISPGSSGTATGCEPGSRIASTASCAP